MFCWHEWLRNRPAYKQRRFVLEAENIEKAFELAASHAEQTAEIGQKWIRFDVRSVAAVQLPLELKL